MPDFFCLNTDRRDHAGLYPPGAFYDLELDDRRLRTADRLHVGSVCLVATPTKDDPEKIVFEWFSFVDQKRMLDPKPKPPKKAGNEVRVLFGKPTRPSAILSKADARKAEPYLFN